MITEETMQQLAHDALAYAKSRGASDCALMLEHSNEQNVQVRQQSVEQIQKHNLHGVQVVLYRGRKKSTTSVNTLEKEAMKKAIDQAYSQAGFVEEDKYAALAEQEFLARKRNDLDLYHPTETDSEQLAAMALQAEQAAFATDKRITNSEGADCNTQDELTCLATSHGFNEVERMTEYSLSCAVVAEEKDNRQVDYWYDRSLAFDSLNNAQHIGDKAARRALAKLGSRKIATGNYPILFSPEIAKGYWSSLISAIRGSAIYRKSSFLLDSLDSVIFPEWLSVQESPHIKRSFGSRDFDSEGVASREKTIVDKGRLTTWLLGSYSARKLGLQTTGNGGYVGNIQLTGNTCSYKELCTKMHKGLIVTDTMGHGLNQITGDFSVGAQGLWVENGEIVHPVEEVTIAANCSDMYRGLVALGNDIDTRGSIHCGSLLIDNMMVGA